MTHLDIFERLPAEIEVLDSELWDAPLHLGQDDDCDPGCGLRRTRSSYEHPREEDDR